MIRMVGGQLIREGWYTEEKTTGYDLEGLPCAFTKGSVEVVRTSAAYRGAKVYYARVHLWTTGRDLLTLTTTSQGEWLTEDECMDRVRHFLSLIDLIGEIRGKNNASS